MPTATQLRQEKDAAAIVETLAVNGTATALWLSVQLNISKGTVTNHLRRMLGQGAVSKLEFPRVVRQPYRGAEWALKTAAAPRRVLRCDPMVELLFAGRRPAPTLPDYASPVSPE